MQYSTRQPLQVKAIRRLSFAASVVNILSFLGYVFFTSENDPSYHDPVFIMFFLVIFFLIVAPFLFLPYWLALLSLRHKSVIAKVFLYIYFITIFGDLVFHLETIRIFSLAFVGYVMSIITVGLTLILFESSPAKNWLQAQ